MLPDDRRERLVHEIWHEFRPYLLDFMVDFLVSAALWTLLFLFKLLTTLLPIGGWAGTAIVMIHSASAILAFTTLGVLFTQDIFRIRRGQHAGKGGFWIAFFLWFISKLVDRQK